MMTSPTVVASAVSADRAAMATLLAECGLPLDGLAAHWDTAFVVHDDGGFVVGCAALELYAGGALLRSVAVAPHHRGTGVGRALAREAVRRAEILGLPALYLLTTTAEAFFRHLGFERVPRATVPADVQTSAEFISACPASAAVMRMPL